MQEVLARNDLLNSVNVKVVIAQLCSELHFCKSYYAAFQKKNSTSNKFFSNLLVYSNCGAHN